MIITINTDASYCPLRGAAAYAFWIVSNRYKFKQCGMLRGRQKNPSIAEFKAIVNAVYCLPVSGGATKLIINTDSLNAVHLLKNDAALIRRWGLGKWGLPLREKLYEILHARDIDPSVIDVRHVPAHRSTDTARAWVNDWLDQNAKNCLRNYIYESK